MRRLSESEKAEIWDRFEAGESLRSAIWAGGQYGRAVPGAPGVPVGVFPQAIASSPACRRPWSSSRRLAPVGR